MYSVPEYLKMLKLAKRAPATIRSYHGTLLAYARFLDVPLDKIHNHLEPENLVKYAASLVGGNESATRTKLSILHRYFQINGVKFDVLESNILKAQRNEDPHDKPLELRTLQQMMELGSVHARAMIAFWISTGCRRSESANILISEVSGDTVRIRNEIAKNRKGGTVYLTAEARDYLDLWLKERDAYIRHVNKKKFAEFRPADDQRLFACSGNTMRDIWMRLYHRVDGDRYQSRDRCTIHSCRKYFRTQAARTMPLDLVEKIMRHSGYLTSSYVRISDEEARRLFHEGEHALYITKRDSRIAQAEIEILKKERDKQSSQLEEVKERMAAMERQQILVEEFLKEKKRRK